MDVIALTAGVAAVLAMLNVVTAGLVAWGLAGGDGEPDTPLAGAMALATLIAAPVAAWQVLALLPTGPRWLVAGGVAVSGIGAVARISTHPDGPHAVPLGALALIVISLPVVVAMTTSMTSVGVRGTTVALATVPVIGLGAALALSRRGRHMLGGWSPSLVAAAGSLVAVALLLVALARA